MGGILAALANFLWPKPQVVRLLPSEDMKQKDPELWEQIKVMPIGAGLRAWFDSHPEDCPPRWRKSLGK